MKLIYDFNSPRETKCYFLLDDGTKEYVDFWNLKTDKNGHIETINSWKPAKIREKNYKILNEMRGNE